MEQENALHVKEAVRVKHNALLVQMLVPVDLIAQHVMEQKIYNAIITKIQKQFIMKVLMTY